jgi:hypothetical protein
MGTRWLIVPALLALAVSACGSTSSSTASESSPSPSTAQTEPSSAPSGGAGSGQLDPAVATPSGFPSNVPVYGGARLTTGGASSNGGTTIYGMVWETTDSQSQVVAYYQSQLAQGDWTLVSLTSANGLYAGEFTSKSNSKVVGTMSITTDPGTGVTKVTVSLVNAG